MIYFICGLLTALFAQENTDDKTLSPYFAVLGNDPGNDQLPLKSTSAEVNIVGVIADVTINQVYTNEGKNALEAVYTFPASSNAAVYAMEMTIGERKIVAVVKEKNQARQEYEQAKSEGKRTSLLEQQRPNVFQMNVANILPGDEIKVSLKYTEMLIPEGGTYSFIYPTVVGPRYSNQSASSASVNDLFVQSPYQKKGEEPLYNFDIHVNISAGMPIQNIVSPTHKISVTYPETSMASVQLDKSETKGGNRDFVVNYQLSGDKIASGLMLYEHGDENFFLMMVQPPKRTVKEEIPPREYIFIVDVSGSMCGFPLTVSKKLLRNLVVNLRSEDMFNVLVFAGSSGWLSEESLPANSVNVEKAIQFFDSHQGGGGTELLPALEKALSFPRKSDNLSRSFVIITDGYVSVEKEAFDLVQKNRDNANTFVFGIGSSVNRYIIDGMAHAGLGEPFIVLNEQEAGDKAEKFRQYINNPVLTQIRKTFSNFDAYDVEPVSIPDVFAERPVILYGKYHGEPRGTITLKGKTGKKGYVENFDVKSVRPDAKNSAIRYLWARKRIQMLDDYNKLEYNDSRIQEVTGLGLKYNLMTAYTSFLAVEEKKVNNGELKTVQQPLPMPAGVENSAIGFELELDEEEFSFSFHKEIAMVTNLSENYKDAVLKEVENSLITTLNYCLSSYDSFTGTIEITVDANGVVTNVKFNGNSAKSELENCLKKTIQNWNFKKFSLKQEWKFRIEF